MEIKLTKMVDAGLIEHTISKHNTPLLVVKKRDTDKIRIVNSYVKLNRHIPVIRYPLPNLNNILHDIAVDITSMQQKYGALCFICLDN